MLTLRLLPWLILPSMLASSSPEALAYRQVSGRAAQWKVGGLVESVTLTSLFNTTRSRHLAARSDGLVWENTAPGQGKVIFENCTRPGEAIYSSDRVAIRFGSRYMGSASGGATLGDNARNCDFRLIPSGAGLVPAGSGNGVFGIYSISANRYVVDQPVPLTSQAVLRWEATANGQPPGNVAARADFVPVEIMTTTGTIGNETVQGVHLTIQNIGNVRSSASQREMELTINGEKVEFVIVQPLAPGALLRSPVRLNSKVSRCAVIHLDTRARLKFQVGEGAFPNDDVFANDKKTLAVRMLGGSASRPAEVQVPCTPQVIR
ncbi:MAG: hypothetical protein V4617_10080 [Gemmatimonadota bacterium]